jgi:Tfp pilus assembly protein PilV
MAIRRAWVSAASDAGMTAIEMVVALLVITLVATASVGVVVQTLRASRTNELRVNANQLAQDTLEDVVAQPWAAIGLYAADTGYQATTIAGESTVTLTTSPAPAGRPRPSLTPTKSGVQYTVRTDIGWYDDPSDGLGAADTNGNTHDMKHVMVSVSWTTNGKTRSLTIDDLRSPTASEAAPTGGSGFTITVTAPASMTLASDGTFNTAANNPRTMTVTATTSKSATSATLSYTTRNGTQTAAMTNVSGGTSWSVTLPATTGPFDTGPTVFSVAATSGTSTGNGAVTVQLNGSGNSSATVTVHASPDQQLTSAGLLSSAIAVSVTTSATASSGMVAYLTHAGGSNAVTKALTGSGTSWSYTIPVDTTVYDGGTEVFTVTMTVPDGTTQTSTASVILSVPLTPPDVTGLSVSYSKGTSFCADGNSGNGLFYATTITATVNNVSQTDTVRLIPGGAAEQPMTYVSTNANGSLNFAYVAPKGTTMPANGSIVLDAYATKTLGQTTLRDDYTLTVAIQYPNGQGNCS